MVTLRVFTTRRLIRWVSNLGLVALEQLLSIEGAVENRMDVTFLRANGFPYEGKLSPEATDEVDSAA